VCQHLQKNVLLLNLYKLWVMTHLGLSPGDCIKILLYTSTGCLTTPLGDNRTVLWNCYFVEFCVFFHLCNYWCHVFCRKKANKFNPLNAELNPICHLLALLRAHPILHVSRIRVNQLTPKILDIFTNFLQNTPNPCYMH